VKKTPMRIQKRSFSDFSSKVLIYNVKKGFARIRTVSFCDSMITLACFMLYEEAEVFETMSA